MLEKVLDAFGLDGARHRLEKFGSGLIHHTYKILDQHGEPVYILQKVNNAVFKKPEDVAFNLQLLSNYLEHHHKEYLFTRPIKTLDREDYCLIPPGEYYRLFEFIPGTHTIDVCVAPEQALEAAAQFGRFTAIFSGLKADMLRYTIPEFHNLSFRYRQFEEALKNGNPQRLSLAKEEISQMVQGKDTVDKFEWIRQDPEFRIRVTHHDTKINNVLFNSCGKGVAVIDLDTVMPGYFISDFGDMMRTFLSPASEEEADLSTINVREDFFEAIASGYLGEMKYELTDKEKEHLVYAGKFMTYMQALRFLTDHLNNDVYYGARYEGHNFLRARNQLYLLQRIRESEGKLNTIVNRMLH